MIKVSLLDFLRTGAFGQVRLGMSRAQVCLLINRPIVPVKRPDGGRWFIWKEGTVEWHFDCHSDRLFLIHSDSFKRIIHGSRYVQVDPWLLRRGLARPAVEAQLRAASIGFRRSDWPMDGDALSRITTEGEVELTFLNQGRDGQGGGLEAISCVNYDLLSDAIADDALEFEGVPSPAEALRQVHARIRGSEAEATIWPCLIGQRRRPIPADIAHDLIDRELAIEVLAQTRQVDAVQWRLAERSPQACALLAVEFYTRPEHSPAVFAELLARSAESTALLADLARLDASTPEKEQRYLAAVRQHPAAACLLARHAAHQRVRRAQAPDAHPAELAALFVRGEPPVLRALAANPRTPAHLLQALAGVEGISYAPQIRRTARQTLDQQQSRPSR